MWFIVFCLVYFFIVVMLILCHDCIYNEKIVDEQYVIIESPDRIDIGVVS